SPPLRPRLANALRRAAVSLALTFASPPSRPSTLAGASSGASRRKVLGVVDSPVGDSPKDGLSTAWSGPAAAGTEVAMVALASRAHSPEATARVLALRRR